MATGKRTKTTQTKTTGLQPRLYLGDLNQERIKPASVHGVPVADYFKPGDPSIVICCDGFCCILDCDRPRRPGEEVVNPSPDRQWSPELVIRKERFGGLVWNRRTGHVWQIDKRVTAMCFDFARGKTLAEVSRKHDVSESDLFSLLAEVTRQL